MTTARDTSALLSVAGHYGIQYPNHDAPPITVPAGERLVELSWLTPEEGWKAYAWHREAGLIVVWVRS